MRVHKFEETACDFCLDIFAKWRVKPNDAALSVPAAWLLCYITLLPLPYTIENLV